MKYRTTVLASLALAALATQPQSVAAQTAAPEAPAAGAPAAAPPPAPYTPPAAASEVPSASDAGVPPTVEAPAAESPAAEAPSDGAVAPRPAGDDAVIGAAQSLTTAVEDVQIVGPWMDGERNGVWRTIMMQVGTLEKDSYRFFIQQIERTAEAATILSTTEITEIPGIDGAIVGYRADEPSEEDPSGLTLFFDIVPSDGEIAETYELHFFKDQPYTFGPATN